MFFSFPTEKFTEKEQRKIFFRRIIRRVFLEDWGTKLIALAVTAALWLGVTGFRTTITSTLRPIPLIVRVPSDMENTNSSTSEIMITLSGDSRKVDQISNLANGRELAATVDLTALNQGDHTVQLTPETINIDIPNGIKIVRIEPSKIQVRIEKVLEREVPVKAEIDGNPADGFEVYSSTIVPAKVHVRGTERLVKSLDSIATEKVNVDGLKANQVIKQVNINLMNPKITLFETTVDVSLVIGEKRVERLFSLPIKSETNKKAVSFVVFGGRSTVEKLHPDIFKIEITKGENGVEIPEVSVPGDLQGKIEIRKVKIS